MKNLIIVLSIFILWSCKQEAPKEDIELKMYSDSLTKAVKEETRIENLKNDSVKITNAPIKIIKARIIQTEYSTFKDIEIKYKNNSDKKISAIRFEWNGINAFGDPAEMGNLYKKGNGRGFTDDALSVGKSRTSTWNLVSDDAKKITDVKAIEVVFEDGSKWRY